jgi:hypothetical protein
MESVDVAIERRMGGRWEEERGERCFLVLK